MQEMLARDFRGDPVVKNPPANAGDTSSVPDPGGSHMLKIVQPRLQQYVNL